MTGVNEESCSGYNGSNEGEEKADPIVIHSSNESDSEPDVIPLALLMMHHSVAFNYIIHESPHVLSAIDLLRAGYSVEALRTKAKYSEVEMLCIDRERYERVSTLQVPMRNVNFAQLAFLPDGKMASVGMDDLFHVWRLPTHLTATASASTSTGMPTTATKSMKGGDDKVDTPTQALAPITSVRAHHGKCVACVTTITVPTTRRFRDDDGNKRTGDDGNKGIGDNGNKSYIITGGYDLCIRVWDSETVECVSAMTEAHRHAVRHLVALPVSEELLDDDDEKLSTDKTQGSTSRGVGHAANGVGLSLSIVLHPPSFASSVSYTTPLRDTAAAPLDQTAIQTNTDTAPLDPSHTAAAAGSRESPRQRSPPNTDSIPRPRPRIPLPFLLLSASTIDPIVKIWNPQDDAHAIGTLQGHGDGISTMVVLKHQRINVRTHKRRKEEKRSDIVCAYVLATGSYDRSIRVWELSFRREIAGSNTNFYSEAHISVTSVCTSVLSSHSGPISALVELRSGTIVSACWDNTIRFWVEEWLCHKSFSLLQCVPIRFLCVLGDGETLISGNEDYSLRIWDTDKPTAADALIKTMYAHTLRVLTLAVLPDGVTVVSAGFGGALSVWKCNKTY